MVGWTSFKAVRKDYNSSIEYGQIIKMSSIYIYRHQTNGTRWRFVRKSDSSLPMKIMARLGAHFVPILVPDTCS